MLKLAEPSQPQPRPLALLIAAHPIWNVPPFINAALELSKNGYRVRIVGYGGKQLPAQEKIDDQSTVLRLQLFTRHLRWATLRKPLALLEFLFRARTVVRQMRPAVLITFNDPACILQKITGARGAFHRVNWLLEYPELERVGLMERLLLRTSSGCWNHADFLVVPTMERLALHLALRPECNARRAHVIQNAPRRQDPTSRAPVSERTRNALRHLENLKPGTLRIVYSGAIGNRYATDDLIEAAGDFPTGVQLLLLGAKHPLAQREVDAALKKASFPQNVHWIDEVPYRELPHVLAACDAGFATYRGDTLNTRFSAPGKLYEYLKNSLVILSDSDCCIRADVRAVSCGVFFPQPATTKGIRESIAVLLNNPEKLHEMKSASRALFEGHLCMEKQIAPLIEELKAATNLPTAFARLGAKIHSLQPPYLKAG